MAVTQILLWGGHTYTSAQVAFSSVSPTLALSVFASEHTYVCARTCLSAVGSELSSLPAGPPASELHRELSCGTKLIEDDWFFPGCSDPALASRQQELEEELAQAQGLRQQRGKKLGETATRSLQVRSPNETDRVGRSL